MEQLVINVDNKEHASLLMRLLRSMSFVVSASAKAKSEKRHVLPKSRFSNKEDFWSTFGSGVDTSIDIDRIRSKAWRRQNP